MNSLEALDNLHRLSLIPVKPKTAEEKYYKIKEWLERKDT